MHVMKFEAETMDKALKKIKKELGPDAIILKTTTNDGIKGAFKKSKVEITAAISEKDYIKKAKVDQVLNEAGDELVSDEDKDKFYNNSSSYISQKIDEYNKIGLNRPVQKMDSDAPKPDNKSGLDQFLAGDEKKPVEVKARPVDSKINLFSEAVLTEQREKIDELERKIFELTSSFKRMDKDEPIGVFQLRTTLKSLGISEAFIQEISKKALFELSKDDLQDIDQVIEFALREMLSKIETALPLFSSVEHNESPVVTVLLSEVSCGQTATLYKLGVLKEGALLVRPKGEVPFAEDIFNLSVKEASTIPDYVSSARSAVEEGRPVFLDYNSSPKNIDETRNFIDGLRRAFKKVEVLICLSSIQGETYNRRIIERYKSIAEGIIVTKLDLCLDYGSLFNIGREYRELPFKFFTTGEIIPENLEPASAERILSGIFKLS